MNKVGVDPARPGSDLTVVALIPPRPVTVFSKETLAQARLRLLMRRGRKSQKATQRRRRFERNRAKRLEAANLLRVARRAMKSERLSLAQLVELKKALRPWRVPDAIPVVMTPRQLEELAAHPLWQRK